MPPSRLILLALLALAGAAPLPAAAEPEESVAPSDNTSQPPAAPVAPLAAVPSGPELDIPAAVARLPGAGKADKSDHDGLIAAYAARNGKHIWIGPKGASKEAARLAAEIRNAGNWGLKAAAFDVPKLTPASPDAPDISPEARADTEVRLTVAFLKYARHARGGRFEPRSVTKYLDRDPQVYDPASLVEQAATAADPAEYLRNLHPKHQQFQKLREKYLAQKNQSSPEAMRLLANMEEWRWMPELGSFYVWVNVPEYTIRVVSDGKVVHEERVVVGKLDTQTPIFSQPMQQVIFHPFWGVPNSIKANEILPSLRGNQSVLKRHNLRIQSRGRDIDPQSVDWSSADIRNYHVYQPPGGGNVLGVVKFRFPNKHDVYMHDTPSKGLFKQQVRAFSHGCMRVRNPVKLAEILLAKDKNMSADRVKALAGPGGGENNQVNLSRPIPVHVTYFTAAVDEKGKLATYKDLYGHEQRIRLALEGKMHLIQPVPEPKGPQPAEPIGNLAEAGSSSDWLRRSGPGGEIWGGNTGN